jgi:type I restriction enzyme S subunit
MESPDLDLPSRPAIKQMDSLVLTKERLLKKIGEARHALITKAVTCGVDDARRLKNSEIPWLGNIPEHWRVLRGKFLWKETALPVREGDEMVKLNA